MNSTLRQILISPSDDDTIFDLISYHCFLSMFDFFCLTALDIPKRGV